MAFCMKSTTWFSLLLLVLAARTGYKASFQMTGHQPTYEPLRTEIFYRTSVIRRRRSAIASAHSDLRFNWPQEKLYILGYPWKLKSPRVCANWSYYALEHTPSGPLTVWNIALNFNYQYCCHSVVWWFTMLFKFFNNFYSLTGTNTNLRQMYFSKADYFWKKSLYRYLNPISWWNYFQRKNLQFKVHVNYFSIYSDRHQNNGNWTFLRWSFDPKRPAFFFFFFIQEKRDREEEWAICLRKCVKTGTPMWYTGSSRTSVYTLSGLWAFRRRIFWRYL